MFGFGVGEAVVVAMVATLIFGVGRLSKLGSAVSISLRNLREGIKTPDSLDCQPSITRRAGGEGGSAVDAKPGEHRE